MEGEKKGVHFYFLAKSIGALFNSNQSSGYKSILELKFRVKLEFSPVLNSAWDEILANKGTT